MPDFTAANVAALRKATGAGMMDCKKALEETGGDLDAAKDWLRSKGLAGAGKRAGRSAQQGAVDVVVEDGGAVGGLAAVNCETDFVAKGTDFTAFVTTLARQVAERGDENVESEPFDESTVGDAIKQLGAKVGENVSLGRVHRFESPDGVVDGYKHIQNDRGTIGVLVELGGVDRANAAAQSVAHDVALHVASAAPRWVRREDVPSDTVEKERKVLEDLTRNEGKPEQAVPKIVEGRLNAFYKDQVLLEQPFIREPKTTVGKLVADLGGDATIRRFVRVKIGEE